MTAPPDKTVRVVAPSRRRLALAHAFAGAASQVLARRVSHVGREMHHWRSSAQQIPDPVLRRLALVTQRRARQPRRRGRLRDAGSARHRADVVRAAVAFQATYDYIDTLAEQPSSDPSPTATSCTSRCSPRWTRDRALRLLRARLELPRGQRLHPQHDRHVPQRVDRAALLCVGRTGALRAARRMIAYQSLTQGAAGVRPSDTLAGGRAA